jgi:uncharacterized protein YjaG (DUF416 family)
MAIQEIELLSKMSFEKQIAFAYLSCERVFPAYKYFSSEFDFGDPELLRAAIDFIYRSIFNSGYIDKERVSYFLPVIHENVPDTEDFDTVYVTYALDSGAIIYESINLLNNAGNERILKDISTMSTDSVDCYIQMRDNMDYNDADFEGKILNDKLMQTELAIQKGIISYLSKIEAVEPSDIDTLVKLQGNNASLLPV